MATFIADQNNWKRGRTVVVTVALRLLSVLNTIFEIITSDFNKVNELTNDTIYGIINKADPCSFRSCLPSASATKFQLTRKAMPSLATFSIDSPSNCKSLSPDATEFLQLTTLGFHFHERINECDETKYTKRISTYLEKREKR